jgi:hypothetical protein
VADGDGGGSGEIEEAGDIVVARTGNGTGAPRQIKNVHIGFMLKKAHNRTLQ